MATDFAEDAADGVIGIGTALLTVRLPTARASGGRALPVVGAISETCVAEAPRGKLNAMRCKSMMVAMRRRLVRGAWSATERTRQANLKKERLGLS